VTARHAARVSTLPAYHRDPFDRLLVAQAMHETMRLLTSDATLARYSELVVTVD
jgi:PIN domain nuclease of toxin-antitoxin system